MTNLDSIFKSRDITLLAKVHLVKAMVFPGVMYGCESWTVKKAECRIIDAFELWCWRRLLRVPWTARRSNQSILKEINPGISLEGMMLKLNSSTLATSCGVLTHWKRLWCWEGLGAGEEGDDRGWDGWMASLTRWTWVWVNSGSWWWTGRPGVLPFIGLQRVRYDWATELNWTDWLYSLWCSIYPHTLFILYMVVCISYSPISIYHSYLYLPSSPYWYPLARSLYLCGPTLLLLDLWVLNYERSLRIHSHALTSPWISPALCWLCFVLMVSRERNYFAIFILPLFMLIADTCSPTDSIFFCWSWYYNLCFYGVWAATTNRPVLLHEITPIHYSWLALSGTRNILSKTTFGSITLS